MVCEISIDSDCERWRLRCPRGHYNWEATSNGWYCRSCNDAGREPFHETLRDQKSGQLLRREEVDL